MAPQTIDTVPDGVTDAGQSFDYPDPPVFVTIDLVNIPTDPNHQNTGLDQAAYDTFIDAQIADTDDPTTPGGAAWTVVDQVMYDPEYSPKLDIDYDTAVRLYNYGRITFPGGRRWYVFYTPTYLNPNATLFRADIDEFPSFTWGLGYSMIQRGHIAVAASQDDTYGANFLTAPEPIDAPPVRGVVDAEVLPSSTDDWTVLVISANDLRGTTGGETAFWELSALNDEINQSEALATAATIDSAGIPQTHIPFVTPPWSHGSPPGPPPGPPANGFLPDDYLTVLTTAGGVNPAQAELETAAAWANVVAAFPGAHISPTVSGAPASPAGYWDHDLDVAIHADPSLYGITDPDLAPIGESPHGLGIRINVEGVTAGDMAPYGFSEFNAYTYTYQGPYVWDESGPTPGDLDVYVPAVTPSPVSTIDGVAAGGGCYLFTQSGWATYMNTVQGAPWVTAGIAAIRLVPSWALSGGADVDYAENIPSSDPTDASWTTAAAIPVYRAEVVSATANPAVLTDWRDSALSAVGVNAIWRKILTSQFTDLMVGNGAALESFLPDQWETSNVAFVAVTGAAHGDPSIRIIPVGYNDLGSQLGIETPVGGNAGLTREGYGVAASNTSQADMTQFMAAYGVNSSWNVQFRQRELAQNLGLENVQLSLGAAQISNQLAGVTGVAKSAFEGAALAGAPGAAIGAGSAIAGAAVSQINAGVSADNTIQLLAIETDGSFDIGALQLGIGGLSAYYAYQAAVQALDSVPGGGSPDSLASAWRAILGVAFEVIIAMPTAERIKALVSTWERYGYMIGQAFTPPRLDVMTKFSYWQTDGALITGSTPQEKRQTIAEAFDRGVTLWNDLADIGTDVTGDNTPVDGVTY